MMMMMKVPNMMMVLCSVLLVLHARAGVGQNLPSGGVQTTRLPMPTRSPLPGSEGGLCSIDQPCSGADLYCSFPSLLCGGTGQCMKMPTTCTLESRPVCGCNLIEYANPCLASAAGQSLFALAACNATGTCFNDSDCGAKQHCRFPAGECSGFGLCSDIPTVCTLEYRPVCGCDNQTYSNPCDAYSSGVSISQVGECEDNTFACLNNSDCLVNEYCRYPSSQCGGKGTCVTNPRTCTLELNPVCGCDNKTYDNPCFASTAGISIASFGTCGESFVCLNDSDCDAGQFCQFDQGMCGGMGSCVTLPEACTSEANPVCGCDFQTYDNPCTATINGVSILELSSCPETVPCMNSSDCEAEQYCRFPLGTCGKVGFCTNNPGLCNALYRPVCGCDNVTYANPCLAASEGASISSQGECGSQGSSAFGCSTNADCHAGEHCQLPDGQCEGVGTCVQTPDVCTLELRPVCGCDGNTYGNPCAARAQGVSISSSGSCNGASAF